MVSKIQVLVDFSSKVKDIVYSKHVQTFLKLKLPKAKSTDGLCLPDHTYVTA